VPFVEPPVPLADEPPVPLADEPPVPLADEPPVPLADEPPDAVRAGLAPAEPPILSMPAEPSTCGAAPALDAPAALPAFERSPPSAALRAPHATIESASTNTAK